MIYIIIFMVAVINCLIWFMIGYGFGRNYKNSRIVNLKDKALEYIGKLCLVYENSDKKDLKNVQKIMDNIYQYAHCVLEKHSCYAVHEDWRKELKDQRLEYLNARRINLQMWYL